MKTQDLLNQWEQSVADIQSVVDEASTQIQSSISAGETYTRIDRHGMTQNIECTDTWTATPGC